MGLYLKVAILAAFLTISLCQSGCPGGPPQESENRKGLFAYLGKGNQHTHTNSLPLQSSEADLGMRKRVIDLQFMSTHNNPSFFCGQDHFISFGSRCNPEPEWPDEVFRDIIQSEEDIFQFFYKWSTESDFDTDSYFRDEPKYNEMKSNMLGLINNGQKILVETVEVITHMTQIEQVCNSELTHEFHSAIANLPAEMNTAADQAAYQNIFSLFGTTFIESIQMGGRAIQITPFSGSAPNNRNVNQFFSDSEVLEYFGGNVIAINQADDNKHNAWFASLTNNPSILYKQSQLLVNLLTPRFFPNDQNIGAKAENLDSFIPKPPSSYEIIWTDGSQSTGYANKVLVAPEGHSMANFKFNDPDLFRSLCFAYINKDVDSQLYESSGNDPQFIINFVIAGGWFFPLDDLTPVTQICFDSCTINQEDVFIIQTDQNDLTDPYVTDYEREYGYSLCTNNNNPIKSMKIYKLPNVPPASYDVKVKWTDLIITYHDYGDIISRPGTNHYISDINFKVPQDYLHNYDLYSKYNSYSTSYGSGQTNWINCQFSSQVPGKPIFQIQFVPKIEMTPSGLFIETFNKVFQGSIVDTKIIPDTRLKIEETGGFQQLAIKLVLLTP